MRTLFLLRHAKSSWDDERLADFDRPLAARGRKAAPLMGRHMRDIGLAPDLVLCSGAVRTRETARLVLAELGRPDLPVIYDDTIYEASPGALLDRLRRLPAGVRHLLMIGHNPGLQDLALTLAGDKLAPAHAGLAVKLPTGSLVEIELDCRDWRSLVPRCGVVTRFVRPRDLATG